MIAKSLTFSTHIFKRSGLNLRPLRLLRRPFSKSEVPDPEKSIEEFMARLRNTDVNEMKSKPAEEVLNSFMKEKHVTLALINATSVQEIEDILEKADLSKLTIEEISLFLYYLGDLEGPLSTGENRDISHLITKGLLMFESQDDKEQKLSNLLKCLGILCAKKNWVITNEQSQIILENIKKLQVTDQNLVETLIGIAYTFELTGQEQNYKVAVMRYLKNSEEILMSKEYLPGKASIKELSEILFILCKAEYHSEILIEFLLGNLLKQELDPYALVNTLIALHSMNYSNQATLDSLYELFLKNLSSINGNSIVTALDSCSKNGCNPKYISKLLGAANHTIKTMSIDAYIGLWRSISLITVRAASIKGSMPNVETTMKLLKKNFGKTSDEHWGMADLDTNDILSILSSLSALKDRDVSFVQPFIKEAFKRDLPNKCSGIELVVLTKNLFAYSNIFEDAFLDIHKACEKRMNDIPEDFRPVIADIFKLKKDVIRKSAFF